MKEIVATARLVKGRLHVRNWSAVADSLASMKDRELLIRIEAAYANRSQQQNRWYWGCLVQAVADHTGYTPDEIHEIFKAKFIPKRLAVTNGNGEIRGEFVLGGSTSKLDTIDFAQYCESIREWAALDLGLDIPDPQQGAAR